MTFYERAKELVAKMVMEEKIGQMRYDAPAIPAGGEGMRPMVKIPR